MQEIRYRFPSEDEKNRAFEAFSPVFELDDEDEVLVNNNGVIRKIKAKNFSGKDGKDGERWPQGEKWEKLLFSDLTSEEKLEIKGEKWDRWEKWEAGEAWPVWPRWEKWEQWIQGERWVPGPRWEQGLRWEKGERWEQGPQWPAGAGTGDLLSKNNLSDLADKTTARENLKVYSKAEVDGKIPTLPDLSSFLQKTEFENEKNNFNKKFSDLPNFWTFVLKESWKWLSSNDFTNEEKNDLSQIAQGLPGFVSRVLTLEKNFWSQKNLIDAIPETYVNKTEFTSLDSRFLRKADKEYVDNLMWEFLPLDLNTFDIKATLKNPKKRINFIKSIKDFSREEIVALYKRVKSLTWMERRIASNDSVSSNNSLTESQRVWIIFHSAWYRSNSGDGVTFIYWFADELNFTKSITGWTNRPSEVTETNVNFVTLNWATMQDYGDWYLASEWFYLT